MSRGGVHAQPLAPADNTSMPATDRDCGAPEHPPPLLQVVDDVATALEAYRQGDYLPTLTSLAVLVDGVVMSYWAPDGVVVISQTCDVVQRTHLAVAVAPVIRPLAEQRKYALKGARPQWAHLPALGDEMFADLDIIGTVAKAEVTRHARTPGVTDLREAQRFAQALARKFARFAFPDEVVPWLAPLRKLFTDKANKLTSALGRVLDDVVELRIEATPDWYTGGALQLMLHVIVRAGGAADAR